jgi:hypothetical protein
MFGLLACLAEAHNGKSVTGCGVSLQHLRGVGAFSGVQQQPCGAACSCMLWLVECMGAVGPCRPTRHVDSYCVAAEIALEVERLSQS